MRNALGALADRIVSAVVPKTTAGACPCNGCEPEFVPTSQCTSGCARVCRGCNCNFLSYSCLSAVNCQF
jgi:hypothetical protein